MLWSAEHDETPPAASAEYGPPQRGFEASKRLDTLLTIWSWLPAFRVVAETEHLPTAARRLRVTPPAVSRTVRILEDALGQVLFERTGRALRLNANGRRLLADVQRAMHVVDAGVAELPTSGGPAPIYVSASGMLAQAVMLPALRELRARDGSVFPHVLADGARGVADLLRTGRIDAGVSSAPIPVAGLPSMHVGEATQSVYCGRSHPLFARRAVSPRDVEAYPFIGSSMDDEPWDALERKGARRVAMRVDRLEVAVQMCADGQLLAILPDCAVHARVREGALSRLALPELPPVALRVTLGALDSAPRRASSFVDAVRVAFARAVAESSDDRAPETLRRAIPE